MSVPTPDTGTAKSTLSQAIYNQCDVVLDRQCKNLIGKILTVSDATFSDPIQRKAFKDVVEEKLYEHLNNLRKISFHLYEEIKMILDEDKKSNCRVSPRDVFISEDDLDYVYSRKEK